MKIIRRNDSGDEVKKLQEILISLNYKLIADGIFGKNTENAVMDFQKSMDLSPDGIVGKGTWGCLLDNDAIELRPNRLTEEDFIRAAKTLNVEVAAIKAVQEVETGGRKGFFKDGMPSILFEGHIFWVQLKKVGIDPEQYSVGNEDILYRKWTKAHYLGGMKEYDRLNKAIQINHLAALSSASWGAFQIMGFNYSSCGCNSVEQFVKIMQESEGAQLTLFTKFILTNKLDKPLRELNWAEFARRYNGPRYAENKYDVKLERAYKLYAKK